MASKESGLAPTKEESKKSVPRNAAISKVQTVLALVICGWVILYVSDFFEYMGMYVFGAHRAMVMGLSMIYAFLFFPLTKRVTKKAFLLFNIILAFASGISAFYMFFNWERMAIYYAEPSPGVLVLGGIMIFSILEASRRTTGWCLPILGVLFIFYLSYGSFFPSFLFTKSYSYTEIASYFYTSDSVLFGQAAEVFTVTIAIYLILGAFFLASGAGSFFIKLALAIVGRFRGGPAKVSLISSMLFGTISGLAVANVVVSGSVTIPMMKKYGFSASFAGAVEVAASNGGQIMPPIMGAAAFLMADIIGIPYWSVVTASLFPACMYYIAVYFMVDFEAAKRGLLGLDKANIPSLSQTLREGWFFLIPILFLVFLVGYLGYGLAKSGFYATLLVVALSYLRKETRLTPSKMLKAFEDGAHSIVMLAPAAGIIGIVMSSISISGLGATLASSMVQLAGGNLLLLLFLTAFCSIILGMGASTLVVYIVVAALVAPALVQMGIPVLAAHLFVFYFGMMSMVTPPVALAAYAAAAVARSSFWETSCTAARLGIVGYIVPFLFVYEPAFLLQGSFGKTLSVLGSTVLGCIALSGGMIGWFFGGDRIAWWTRAVLILGGLCLIYPSLPIGLCGLFAAAAVGLRRHLGKITFAS